LVYLLVDKRGRGAYVVRREKRVRSSPLPILLAASRWPS
jgi:hypothetical protein